MRREWSPCSVISIQRHIALCVSQSRAGSIGTIREPHATDKNVSKCTVRAKNWCGLVMYMGPTAQSTQSPSSIDISGRCFDVGTPGNRSAEHQAPAAMLQFYGKNLIYDSLEPVAMRTSGVLASRQVQQTFVLFRDCVESSSMNEQKPTVCHGTATDAVDRKFTATAVDCEHICHLSRS